FAIKDVRNLSSTILLQQCRVFHPAMDSECQDISGCISLKIHQSLREDDELYELLREVIHEPCRFIPTGRGFHWRGLASPNFVSYNNLNCGIDRLPYTRAFITFGDTRVEVEL